MPSRGLVAAAALVGVALACLASLRKIERERRLIGRLKQGEGALKIDSLSADERWTAQGLERAGVVDIQGRRLQAKPSQLAAFQARRIRFMLSGAFVGLLLATLVVIVVFRR